MLFRSGISKFIRGAIDKVREPVSKAIDWVIKKAKDLAGAILEKLGVNKKDEKDEVNKNKAEDERSHDEMQQDLDAALSKSWKLMRDPALDRETVEGKLPGIAETHRLKVLTTVDVGQDYKVVGEVNPKGETKPTPSEESSQRLTGPEATAKAVQLGYQKQKGAPFNSHGMPTYFNSRTKTWISPDRDGHNGGALWKMFNKGGIRLGTYSGDLSTRIKG